MVLKNQLPGWSNLLETNSDDFYRFEYDCAVEREGHSPSKDDEVSRAFSELRFRFLNAVDLDFVLRLRREKRLSSLRRFLNALWDEVSDPTRGRRRSHAEFRDALEGQYEQYKREWQEIAPEAAEAFVKGVTASGIAILSGQIDFRVALGGAATFGITELLKARAKRRRQERLPLGVFLKLETGA